MALPTSNIGTQIVKELLNTDNNAIWHLCNDSDINKWSKYKPIVGNWPQGDGSYGLNRSGGWSYPTRTPGKINHFAGYEHDTSLAFPPILSISSENLIRTVDPNGGAGDWNSFRIRCYSTTSTVRMSTVDLGLENYYYGVKAIAGGTTYYKTFGKIGDAVNGIQYPIDLNFTIQDPSTVNPSFEDMPYEFGEFECTLIICSTACATWTDSTPDEVINFPTITRDVSATVNTGTFNVLNWVYATNTDMNWTAIGVYTDLSANVYTSWDALPEWQISSKPAWITTHVYDGINEMVNPATWQNGYKLVVVPDINYSTARSGTIDISAGDSSTFRINVSQDAVLVQPTITIEPNEGEVFTMTDLGGSISIGSDQLTFSFTNVNGWSISPSNMTYTIIDLSTLSVASGTLLNVKDDPILEWGETKTISRNAKSGDEFTIILGNVV